MSNETDRPALEAKLDELRRFNEQERVNTPLLQVTLNDWRATADGNVISNEEDRLFLNDRINERIQSLKLTFPPDCMGLRGRHGQQCLVFFSVSS